MIITTKNVSCTLQALILLVFLGLAGCSPVTCSNCQPIQLEVEYFPPINALLLNTDSTSQWRHIYLEGDGIPWKRGIYPSSNPTSKQALSLQLMKLDNADSVYLNRPCYGFADSPPTPCTQKWWTNARYSPSVVRGISQALDAIQGQIGAKPLVLIGFSGGGTLAMLLANQRSDVTGVVTIAGNLDPDAWAQLHNYLPLDESLNPAKQPALPSSIFRWHLVGNKDRNITPDLARSATSNDPAAEIIETQNTHNRGWLNEWPAVLAKLKALEAAQ